MRAVSLAAIFMASLALGGPALASPVLIEAPRSDGQSTPLKVYGPAQATPACAPLALISHGAGGSQNGYAYLAEAMSGLGFTAVVMGHRESDGTALRNDMRSHRSIRGGVEALVADAAAEQARLLDVGAAIAWSEPDVARRFAS